MHRRISRRKVAALTGIPASLVLAQAVWAQTSTWTGASTGSPDNLWTDPTNWDIGAVPVSGSTAAFTNIPSGPTNISLGGANQPIGSITFTGSANAYNLGVTAGDAFTFDSGGSITTNSSVTNAQIISAAIDTTGNFTISNGISNGATSGAGLTGLTVNAITITGGGLLSVSDNGPTETTSLNGVISDVTGQPGSVSLLANTSAANNTIIINGFNTYSGTTSLMVTAQGTIEFSTDSPFGTGKISNFNTPQMQAIGGSHTISNAIDFDAGMNFTGTNTITLAGTLAIINANVNGNRTFAGNGTLTLNWGDPNSPGVFNLGNPVSNGGDGAGKFAAFTFNQPATYVVNDLMQNPGTGSGGVICTFSTTGGTYLVNSLNTYTGATTFSGAGGGSVVSFDHSYVAGGTSGPFGLGTIVFNSTNSVSLQPTGGNQTLANAITLTQGMAVSNAIADNSGLTLAGNITMGNNDRILTNNFSGGSLTLGVATSPATLSLGRNFQIQSQTNGVATVINDLIQNNGTNAGGINVTRGLVQLTNPGNTYTKGTTVNGGTLSVSANGDLGSSSANVSLGGGTLLSTGSFSSARNITLNSATNTNTIDVTSGNTLTLTGSLGGSGDLTKGTNSGILQLAQPSGYSLSGNVNVNGGTLVVGATSVYNPSGPNGPVVISGGMAAPFNVTGTLTINNGGKVALNPSVPGSGVTHSIGSLSIAPSSNLDIGNHTVIVQNAPDETVIGGYLANGYAGGYWNGVSTSGGSITSIVAYNDNSGATSVGYGNSADFTGTPSPYGVGGPKALSGNQVVVQPALAGDLVLTGSVGANELAYMLNSYGTTSYDGSDKNTWAFGNIDYNPTGLVESNDLALLLLNYGATSSGFVAPKTAAVSHSAKTVTTLTGSASPAVNADGIELDVYLATGDVQINGNNATDVSTLYLVSPGAGMIGGTTFTAAFDALFPDNAINSNTEINPYATPGSASAVNGMVDMGDIYNTSLNTMDLLFQFSEKNENRGGLVSSTVVYIGVPEPTTLSLMGLAAAGLLGRRRKSKSR